MTGDRRAARVGLVETIGVSDETDAARQAAIDRFADLLTIEAERLRDDGLLADRDYRLSAVAAVGAVYALINTWRTDPQWDEHIDLVVEEAARAIVGILGSGLRDRCRRFSCEAQGTGFILSPRPHRALPH